MTLGSFISFLIFLYCVYMFIIILGISNEDYDRHRELLLHPENDLLGNTITSMSMGENGQLKFNKRASIGATKRLLHKAWT